MGSDKGVDFVYIAGFQCRSQTFAALLPHCKNQALYAADLGFQLIAGDNQKSIFNPRRSLPSVCRGCLKYSAVPANLNQVFMQSGFLLSLGLGIAGNHGRQGREVDVHTIYKGLCCPVRRAYFHIAIGLPYTFQHHVQLIPLVQCRSADGVVRAVVQHFS